MSEKQSEIIERAMKQAFVTGANWGRSDIALKLLQLDLPEEVRLLVFNKLLLGTRLTDADIPDEVK